MKLQVHSFAFYIFASESIFSKLFKGRLWSLGLIVPECLYFQKLHGKQCHYEPYNKDILSTLFKRLLVS